MGAGTCCDAIFKYDSHKTDEHGLPQVSSQLCQRPYIQIQDTCSSR